MGKFSSENVEREVFVYCLQRTAYFPKTGFRFRQTDYPEWVALLSPARPTVSLAQENSLRKSFLGTHLLKSRNDGSKANGFCPSFFFILTIVKHLCPHAAWENEIAQRGFGVLFTSTFSFLPKGFLWASLCQQCEFSPHCYISLPSVFSPTPS